MGGESQERGEVLLDIVVGREGGYKDVSRGNAHKGGIGLKV